MVGDDKEEEEKDEKEEKTSLTMGTDEYRRLIEPTALKSDLVSTRLMQKMEIASEKMVPVT